MAVYKFILSEILFEVNSLPIIEVLLDAILICLGALALPVVSNKIKIVSASVLLVSLLGLLYNNTPLLTYLNGIREIVIIPSVIFMIEEIRKSSLVHYFFERATSFLFFFLILQFPCTIYQFIKYNGAGDWVGGSLGAYSSGVLTFTIFLCLLFVGQYYLYHKSKRLIYTLIFVSFMLIPTFLNETKITFILLPFLFLCISRIKNFRKIMPTLLVCVLLFAAASSIYIESVKQTAKVSVGSIFTIDFFEYYLLSEVEEGSDVPRLTKLIYYFDVVLKDPVNFFIGMEYGAFKGGTLLEASAFAEKYNWLLLGSRPYIFYMLVSGGIILTLVLLILLYHGINSTFKDTRLDISQYAFYLIIVFTIIIYNDAFRDRFFVTVFFVVQFMLVYLNFVKKRVRLIKALNLILLNERAY